MKNKNLYIDLSTEKMVDQFSEIELQYSVSKEKAWENLVSRMDETRRSARSVSLISLSRIAIAASVLLLIGVTGFFRFYTKTVYSPAGQHISFYLPDNSLIELNAQSKADFHPYWFNISRTVTLDGEAFFKVTPGSRFNVVSKPGETTVLGTSFNIYSRDNDYNVTCFTGKVRVVSASKNERILLNPNEKAFINKDGFLRFAQEANALSIQSWRDNMFVFTSSPVGFVLKEVERQCNIKIVFQANPDLTYTGNFSRSLSGKEVLNLVCTSLGIKFEAKSDSEFLIK